MSIKKDISTYPSTGQGFSINRNFLQNIRGVLLTKKDFTITSEQLDDDTYLFDQFESGNVIPLHFVLDVIPKDEATEYGESAQDFTFELRKGKYRHVLRFDWDLAFNQIIESYSGTDLNVIYYDNDRHLILTKVSEGVYRGLTTNRTILEKPKLFGNGSEVPYSDLDIELRYPKEVTDTGYIQQVEWLPQLIDKRFINIQVESIGIDYLNFTAKYNSTDINNLSVSDIEVDDNTNGVLTYSFFNYLGGVYRLSGFSDNLTNGCLTINSAAYLGRTKYNLQILIISVNNFVFEDGDSIVFEDGNNLIFEN